METPSGLYASRVFPWLNDCLNTDPQLQKLRAEGLVEARGRVIEIGFGTGLNLPLYPRSVTELMAMEPSTAMLRRARPRLLAAPFPVQVVTLGAEDLPFEDHTFDTAVSTLTLCTVADPSRVLAELRRVLRDDGRLILLEHGQAEDPRVARWQDRLDRLQTVVACGCHLNRPIARLAREQGFRFDSVRQFFAPKMPRTHGWLTVGVASKLPLH